MKKNLEIYKETVKKYWNKRQTKQKKQNQEWKWQTMKEKESGNKRKSELDKW